MKSEKKIKKVVKKVAKKSVKKMIVNRVPAVAKAEYNLSLELADDIFRSKGATVIECLDKLDTTQIKSKGTFILSDGNKNAFIQIPSASKIKRLLVDSVQKIVFQKRILSIMK